MKTHCRAFATFVVLMAGLCPANAAVPVRWTAETSRVQPQQLDAWRGDTLDLECTLKSYGQPVALGAATASLMWQTNGMGSAWWQTNAMVSADGVIRATWSPSMDPGGAEVAFFMPVVAGDGASYRAAGRIRFRPSPGAGSRTVELPQPGGTLDFGDFQLVNAPWATLAAANEAISAAVTSATGALVIPPAVDLGPYATTGYVAGAITSATGALAIPPAQDLTPYATTGYVAGAVTAATGALVIPPAVDLAPYATRAYADAVASNAQAAAEAAIPSLDGYATQEWTADYVATNLPSIDLSSYASRSYADAVASSAQASAEAAIPSLDGYATQEYVADYVATNSPPPVDLAPYATRAYADAVASNAQAAAIAAIPSLAGFATETYAQNAASDAASGALSAAQSYARDLSWAASQGNTRLVSIDGTIWQDATGTVWQVSNVYGWRGTALDLATTTARPVLFAPVLGSNDVWSAGVGTNLVYEVNGMQSYCIIIAGVHYYEDDYAPQSATNLTITTEYDKYYLYYSVVALATNPVDHVLYEQSPVLRDIIAEQATGTVARALTYGTPTRWTDAIGCVWDVQTTRACTNANEEWTYTMNGQTYTREQMIEAAGGNDEYYSMILDWEASTFINKDGYSEEFEGWYVLDGSGTAPVGYDFSTGLIPSYASDPYLAQVTYYGNITATRGTLVSVTNLVGRVALTNDLPGAISSTISDFASTGTVHAAETSTYSSRLFDSSFDAAYDATYLIRESTNAAIAVAARKQDALPYPTNAIPYAAISGAPSGGGTPEWRVVQIDEDTPVSFVTNGIAAKLINGELYATTNGWPDGAAMFVRGSVEPWPYDVGEEIRLAGYGTWPTNNFQSVWWRSGATIYVNILVEE